MRQNQRSMVEQWIRDTERIFSASKTYPKDRIEVDRQDINVNVILVASTQYPFYFLPFDSNGSLEGKADGNNIVSGAEIPGGSMIELTATPGNNYMVDYWTVTEGDTGVAENTEKVLEQNGTAVVDPVYIINGLGGFNTVRVHFRELAVNAVKVNDDEAGTGDIVYAIPVNPADNGNISEKSLVQAAIFLDHVDEIEHDAVLEPHDDVQVAQPDIRIHGDHFFAGLRQSYRDVRRGGRLSNTSFSGGNHYDPCTQRKNLHSRSRSRKRLSSVFPIPVKFDRSEFYHSRKCPSRTISFSSSTVIRTVSCHQVIDSSA